MSADGQPVQGSAAARLDDNHRVAAAAAAVLTVTGRHGQDGRLVHTRFCTGGCPTSARQSPRPWSVAASAP